MHKQIYRKRNRDIVVMANLKSKKPVVSRKRKKSPIPNIFNKGKLKNNRRHKVFTPKSILIPLLVIFIILLASLSIKYITSMRSNAFNNQSFSVGNVVGIDNIPEYPGSEFMFKNSSSDPIVKEFISGGNSAYRLLVQADTKNIEEYYKEKLPKKGWTLVSEVQLGAEDKKYGQYWIKDGKGLRIYSKYKDIWYESITEEEAKTALANRVQEEIEREMLMASSEKQDLLPDYQWKIQIPKEYMIKYSATNNKDLRSVSFQKLGSNDIIEIYPLSKYGSKELDFMIEDYCKIKSNEDNKYSVVNTYPVNFRDYSSLKGIIASKSNNMEVIVMPNSYNGIVYIMSSTKENDPLFEYIIENIKPMGSKD